VGKRFSRRPHRLAQIYFYQQKSNLRALVAKRISATKISRLLIWL